MRGIVTLILPDWGNELTFLYTADTEEEKVKDCAEGELKWIPIKDIMSLELWEGDRVFLPLLQERDGCFSLKLIYDAGGKLVRYVME